MPAGDGVWRVWTVLEGLEGLEGFGRFGAFAGGQTAALNGPWPWGACLRSGLGPGVTVGEVALALGCLLGKVFGGFGRFWRVWRVLEGVWRVWKVLEGSEGFGGCLEGLEGFGAFGVFAGWQTAALNAHRKLCCGLGPGVPVGEVALALGCLFEKWPWPWGACWGSGLGPGVPAGEGVWRVWKVLEGLEGFGGCLEGLEGFGGFGGFGGFWRVFGGFWRVWRVLERLECLRAGKRQL